MENLNNSNTESAVDEKDVHATPQRGTGENRETGAQPQGTEGDLEDRRETQQVTRPTTDGIGEGLPKDAA